MGLTNLQGKGIDTEGRWLKKNGRSIFGFKHHEVVDENGLIVFDGILFFLIFNPVWIIFRRTTI